MGFHAQINGVEDYHHSSSFVRVFLLLTPVPHAGSGLWFSWAGKPMAIFYFLFLFI